MIISNDRDMGELELSYIAARNGNVMAILWCKVIVGYKNEN